ncbi:MULTISPECIES: helix-turn-helix domain-containing protein [Nocardia]|uniref:helix-turn-helix domain-containing protein n=1 Tax=Nocardia TaxID=1817 RepID=UPI0009DD3947|nr:MULTISPECIES: helix-turn-helix transcriptional regulator [Nocardia]
MDRGSLDRAFGYELRVRRQEAGLTIDQMWAALRWRRGTYKRTEAGDRSMSPSDIFDVAEILNISPTTFFAQARKRWKAGDYPSPTGVDEWRDILGL